MSIRNIKLELEQIRDHLSPFGRKIINDWSFSLSALMAYYFLIALLPLILCVFSATILITGNNQAFLNATRDRLVESFPEQDFGDTINSLAESMSKKAVWVFIISFIVAIFTGSRLFVGIDDTLTIIYRIRERRILAQNIHAIKMLLVFIIFMPIMIISSTILALLKKNEAFYYVLTILGSGLFAFIFFNLVYHFVPHRQMSWKKTWCGALFAAICLEIVILIFPIYVHVFMTDYIGQFGFIIIALLVFYVFGLLLVIGAQINSYFFDHIQPLKIPLGTCISESADHETIPLIDRDNSISTLPEGSNPS